MNAIICIARHELTRLLKSPLGWIVFAIVQFLLAIVFLFLLYRFTDPTVSSLTKYGVTSTIIATFLRLEGIVLVLLTPFLTMHAISEERQTGSIHLLRSSPVSITELVAGKYLGIVAFFLLLSMVLALMPLSLLLGTRLNLWQFGAGFAGLMLLVSACVSVGICMSTLTYQPALAAAGTLGVLLMLCFTGIVDAGGPWSERVLNYLSLFTHFRHLVDGKLNSTSVGYYFLMSVVFLALSIWRLNDERYN